MMMSNKGIWRKRLYLLAIISMIIRMIIAGFTEFGNDEVYYRLYALYPDWSHFDHPLMVGLVMQLFSFNMAFDSELFLRMSSIILGTINIFIVFNIGKTLKNSRLGFLSALLYTSSIYAFVITGIFILPDTPQQFFWLLSLNVMLKTLPTCPNIKTNAYRMLRMGLLIGLTIISKYTGVFLWFGAFLYILFFNREWLKKKWLYISIFLTFVVSLPILIWNFQNDFISFTFHEARVDVVGYHIDFDYFLTEVLGEFLYNNPVNYILIIIGIFAAFRNKLNIERKHKNVILLASLPLIFLFLGFSLFRSTLPHWTAPGITSLIFLAAAWLDQKFEKNHKKNIIPWPIKLSLGILILIVVLGFYQINYGLINIVKNDKYTELGSNDPSLDMFGYEQIGSEFANIYKKDISQGIMDKNSFMAGKKWFPLANFDYYVATPLGMKSYGFGGLEKIHKYAWINQINGKPELGMDAYYITDSREYSSPNEFFKNYFDKVEVADTIQVYRSGKIAKRAFVFRLKTLKKLPENYLNIE
ncbi:MAG: hypothetical protein C0595_13945 [Marinilabiliales bacterium]|nr:MAG: hypothetical protein C0595_13945 [Marinilabiliales bacterium]